MPVIREIQRAGANFLHQIADALNAGGITTHAVVLGMRNLSAMCWRRADCGVANSGPFGKTKPNLHSKKIGPNLRLLA
jgi:hypothetical protein